MKESSFALRRSYAQLFAQSALVNLEKEIDDSGPSPNLRLGGMRNSSSSFHPDLPIQLDPILSLVVLAIYEYVQRGNVSRMRARINQAVTTAMDMSLHALGESENESSEAQRRAWWITVSLIYAIIPMVIGTRSSKPPRYRFANSLIRCLLLTCLLTSILP